MESCRLDKLHKGEHTMSVKIIQTADKRFFLKGTREDVNAIISHAQQQTKKELKSIQADKLVYDLEQVATPVYKWINHLDAETLADEWRLCRRIEVVADYLSRALQSRRRYFHERESSKTKKRDN